MVELLYALDATTGKMMSVDSVANGIACNCICPSCGSPLVAKNNGETVSPHFAHASGCSCSGAHESELHLLAKEIISEERQIMLPGYGKVYEGGVMTFDNVEVEERNDISCLQPDLCGVKNGSRLWLEIMVTHAIGPEKRALIKRNNIACVELKLSQFINRQVTKSELRYFLLHSKDSREWTNNPKLEKLRLAKAMDLRKRVMEHSEQIFEQMDVYDAKQLIAEGQREFLADNPDCCFVSYKSCLKCKHHTTRIALYEEMKLLHLPSWLKDALAGNMQYYTYEEINGTVEFKQCYTIQFDNYLRLLPTQSPDIHGRPVSEREIRQNEVVIPFLLDTVPAIIASVGKQCNHCRHVVTVAPSKKEAACDMPNVVHKHRRKR